MSAELGFPTEDIELPSKGKFYPEDSPLRSGKISLKYLTAREEDILTSTNLLQQGVVLDKLCDSIIVTKGVKSEDLLLGDINAVMVASRILGYGKEYPIVAICQMCGKSNKINVDLTTLTDKVPEIEPDPDGKFTFILPSGTVVRFQLLTRKNEQDIQVEVRAMSKAMKDDISRELTTRLRYLITEFGGVTDPNKIYTSVDNMLVRDSRALREAYQKATPDLNFDITYDCTCDDGAKQTVRLAMGPDFFWPDIGL